LRDGLKERRSVDTHELPLPGAIKLADFFEDVRRGKAARWLPPEADLAYTAGGLRPRKPSGRRDPREGSAFAVFVPTEDLAT
jgi:hypothetical protein